MRSLARYIGVMVIAAGMFGCALSDDPAAETEGFKAELTDQSLTGSFTLDGRTVKFENVKAQSGLYEVAVFMPDMTLIATMDELGGIDLDGFAANGEDTQMLPADRELLLALRNEVEKRWGADENPLVAYLRSFVGLWSEWSTTLELTGFATAQEGRDYYSLCGYCGWYVEATHDCWDYDDYEDASTYYGLVSMHASGSCSDGTYFWTGSAWSCYEPNHSTTVEYAYGSCFGRCGGGCGTDTRMTWDCLDHDSCVRFGHDTVSFWCDDEFTSCVDDFVAAPNCGSSCGL